jgi:hypothetical protein
VEIKKAFDKSFIGIVLPDFGEQLIKNPKNGVCRTMNYQHSLKNTQLINVGIKICV